MRTSCTISSTLKSWLKSLIEYRSFWKKRKSKINKVASNSNRKKGSSIYHLWTNLYTFRYHQSITSNKNPFHQQIRNNSVEFIFAIYDWWTFFVFDLYLRRIALVFVAHGAILHAGKKTVKSILTWIKPPILQKYRNIRKFTDLPKQN